MRISVLTYHATNISGNEYFTNDHIALKQDLKLFYELGIEILPAYDLIKWMQGQLELDENRSYVVLTFDDGSELDFTDWEHPTCGFQQSFYTILKQHSETYGQAVHATSFVIASDKVRSVLEQTCLGGYRMWGDDWWLAAENSGILSIENHSWDHVHPTLETVCQKHNIKENFAKIENFKDAQDQIHQATVFIQNKIPSKQVQLFAYPYGHYNNYLTEQYFPELQNNILAAFTCITAPVTKATNIWKIPRYVCGPDWKSTHELKNIILTY